jgi:hypothetical protein
MQQEHISRLATAAAERFATHAAAAARAAENKEFSGCLAHAFFDFDLK